jgi:hypothetical protein
MIKHIKRLLGIGQKTVAPTAPTPYKIETPASEAVAPFPVTKEVKAKTEKKPAVKAKTARKPRTPKA